MDTNGTLMNAPNAEIVERGRDLDALVAVEILGWKPAQLGLDARGENPCEVLTRDGKLMQGFGYPNVGKVHRAYHAPHYSSELRDALSLAAMVRLSLDQFPPYLGPEALTLAAIQHHRQTKGLYGLMRVMAVHHASKPPYRRRRRKLS